MRKPIIGITSEIINIGFDFRQSVKFAGLNEDYKLLIENRGGVPLILPNTDKLELINSYMDICDGFVFSGGQDINPLFYDENPHNNLGSTDNQRDLFEINLMKQAIKKDKPILAICRGLQILNIVQGGTLTQDIADDKEAMNHMSRGYKYDVSHKVKLKEDNLLNKLYGDEILVNSSHHQAIDKLGDDLRVLGRSCDGIIEAVKLEGFNFIYGVQWHPEGLVYKDETAYLLVDAFLDSMDS